jgi:hypothetical protein
LKKWGREYADKASRKNTSNLVGKRLIRPDVDLIEVDDNLRDVITHMAKMLAEIEPSKTVRRIFAKNVGVAPDDGALMMAPNWAGRLTLSLAYLAALDVNLKLDMDKFGASAIIYVYPEATGHKVAGSGYYSWSNKCGVVVVMKAAADQKIKDQHGEIVKAESGTILIGPGIDQLEFEAKPGDPLVLKSNLSSRTLRV